MKKARYSHRDESRVAPLARLVEKLSRWALTSNRLGSGLEGLGSIRVPRVVFGVSPKHGFPARRRKMAREDACAPQKYRPAPEFPHSPLRTERRECAKWFGYRAQKK